MLLPIPSKRAEAGPGLAATMAAALPAARGGGGDRSWRLLGYHALMCSSESITPKTAMHVAGGSPRHEDD